MHNSKNCWENTTWYVNEEVPFLCKKKKLNKKSMATTIGFVVVGFFSCYYGGECVLNRGFFSFY